MKKYIILILASVLTLASCEKALERYPLNGPSTGTFPASEEEALAGVLVSYKNLANSVSQYSPYPWRFVDNLTDTLEAFKRGVQTVTTNCAKKQLDEYKAGEKSKR